MDLEPGPQSIAPQPSVTFLGPVDRTSFFDEQRRNRRATWRLAAACAVAVAIVGIPVSLVISPILYAVTLVVLNTINLITPIAGVMALLQGAGALAFSVLDYLSGEPGVKVSTLLLSLGIAAWFIPGVLAGAMIWLGIYFLFKHSGVGSIALSIGARAPNSDDLEERQLGNLIREMALAAGIPSPRLMLLDAEFINAVAIGSATEDATVVVSCRLLDELDRVETQGVIGHLIASVGNGDLRIAFLMTSVLLTFGALVAILKAPFGSRGRATGLRLLQFGLRGWRRRLDGESDRELLAKLIDEGLQVEGSDDQRVPMLLAPFMLASISVQWTLFILVPGLLKPFLALLWRKRRYLAGATAVQLTRNAEGITRALMRAHWGIIPGSRSVAHLFFIGPVGAGNFSEFFNWQGVGFHPPLKQRLMRLRAAGAQADIASFLRSQQPARQLALLHVLKAIIAILLPIMAVTCLAALVLFVLVSLFITGLYLALIHGVFLILGAIKGWILG